MSADRRRIFGLQPQAGGAPSASCDLGQQEVIGERSSSQLAEPAQPIVHRIAVTVQFVSTGQDGLAEPQPLSLSGGESSIDVIDGGRNDDRQVTHSWQAPGRRPHLRRSPQCRSR